MNDKPQKLIEIDVTAVEAALKDLGEQAASWSSRHKLALVLVVCHPESGAPIAFAQEGIPANDPLAVARILNHSAGNFLQVAADKARQAVPPPPKLFGPN